MANSQTVQFPVEIAISYKAPDETEEVRTFSLTLSLTLEEVGAQTSTCGEFTMYGAVMPVEDPKGLPTPQVNTDPDALPEAA